MKISYFKSLRFKLMLLAVLVGVGVSFAFIAVSVYMAFSVKDLAATAYIGAAAGVESSIAQALNNVNVDMGWMAWQWVVIWIAVFICLFFPVTISIRKIITPLRTVARYTDSLALGDVYIDVVKDRHDEIGEIQENFQKLVAVNRQQAELIQRIAEGDLTSEANVLSEKDVIGMSLEKMINNMNSLFSEINDSTIQVSTGSKQVADGAQALAQRSTEQAASVDQLSSTIAEIAERTRTNEEMAGRAAKLASTIMISAEKGSQQMGDMTAAVKEINDASRSISKVMKTIDDIAFQTNILALNAAVEAARAGQHGKGFAVVAEEVRNLASKSAEAAKETGSIIENSIEKAELGSRIAGETAASLEEIVSGISESNQLINEIAKSSGEQSEGIMQVNTGIDQVAQVVQHNSATAEESAAASEEMSGQSALLENLVSQFKLKEVGATHRAIPAASTKNKRQISTTAQHASTFTSDSAFGKY